MLRVAIGVRLPLFQQLLPELRVRHSIAEFHSMLAK
jgi:hypothetical protein